MGNVRNEICAQGLHAGKLLRHAVEAIDDLQEAVVDAEPAEQRNAHAEIPGHDLLRGLGNAAGCAPHGQLAAQGIKGREQQAQQNHVCKGQLGGNGQVITGKHHAQRIDQRIGEQHDAAGHDERRHHKKHKVVAERLQKPLHACLITAL